MHFLTVKTCAKDLKKGEISIFPTERTIAPSFSQEELLLLSDKYSKLNQYFIENISRRLSLYYNLPEPASTILVREAVVPLVHLFMDRLLRADRFLKKHDGTPIAVKEPCGVDVPSAIEYFEANCCSSYNFNQWILCKISEIYDIQVVKSEEDSREEMRDSPAYNFFNYNYKQSHFIKVQRALAVFSSLIMSCISPSCRGKFPALSMAYAAPYLQSKGFFGHSSIASVCGRVTFDMVPHDPIIRNDLLGSTLEQSDSCLNNFVDSIGINKETNRNKILTTFKNYILQMYPSALLESVPLNLSKCLAELKRYNGKCLLFSDVGDTESTYFFAAAKCLKFQIVGVQDGGHHGYEDDYVQAMQAEYNYMDKFISWGWTEFPYNGIKNNIEVIPVPSPWLYHRRKCWEKIVPNKKVNCSDIKFDFLLMPNKIGAYPHAPSGANISRIDHIKAFAELLKELIRKAALNGLTVYHKPYNETTVDLLHYTMKELARLGGDHYRCDSNLSKGLRYELLSQCRMVLWDQPGTGFLECLTSKIPTMILWPRIYNQETACSRPLFLELETVGICHRNVDSLLDEYSRFKNDPVQWIHESKRLDVIERFSRKYAWTERDWQKYWRNFLNSLR